MQTRQAIQRQQRWPTGSIEYNVHNICHSFTHKASHTEAAKVASLLYRSIEYNVHNICHSFTHRQRERVRERRGIVYTTTSLSPLVPEVSLLTDIESD